MPPTTETLPKAGNGVAVAEHTTNGNGGHQLHELLDGAAGDAGRRLFGSHVGRPARHRRQDRRHVQRDRRRQPAHGAAARARRPAGRQGRQDQAARPVRRLERRLGRDGKLGQHPDRRPALADHRSDARDRRRGARRSAGDRASRRRRPPAAGRIPALGDHRQHHDQAARRVHLRGDARRARGRHRRQARRPGPGAGSDRRLEGPDRERELDGVEPDRSGAQPRRGDDRGGERRLVEEDHRRRARRNPSAQGSHQHDGGPAALVRLGSDARGARGRHRRQARRSGHRARRRRHLEGSHRQRQPAGGQPDHAGPQHRASDHRRGARRPVAQDHRGREGRSSGAEGHHQHHGGPAQRLRLGSDARRARGRHRRQARRPGRRCPASPAPGRT